MDTRVPELIKPLLEEYLLLTDHQLPGLLEAFYLDGSLALEDFRERWSDIDFIAVLRRRCTQPEVARLHAIHHRLERTYPRWPWQGEYLRWEDWAHPEQDQVLSLTYHEGRFQPRTHLDLQTSITCWTLKHHGLGLKGPTPQNLDLPVNWDTLLDQMTRNLHTYWGSFTTQPQRLAWLVTDSGIQWTVLGVLRQWYTCEVHDIASKTEAGAHALTHLPQRWHRLIQEALRIREQTAGALYSSRIGRAIDAVRFVDYVIQICTLSSRELQV